MRFSMHRGGSWAGETALQFRKFKHQTSWVGPTIANNDINFGSTNNNPTALGIEMLNCDVKTCDCN